MREEGEREETKRANTGFSLSCKTSQVNGVCLVTRLISQGINIFHPVYCNYFFLFKLDNRLIIL